MAFPPAEMPGEMREVLLQLEQLKVNQAKERVHARKAQIKADVASFKLPSNTMRPMRRYGKLLAMKKSIASVVSASNREAQKQT